MVLMAPRLQADESSDATVGCAVEPKKKDKAKREKKAKKKREKTVRERPGRAARKAAAAPKDPRRPNETERAAVKIKGALKIKPLAVGIPVWGDGERYRWTGGSGRVGGIRVYTVRGSPQGFHGVPCPIRRPRVRRGDFAVGDGRIEGRLGCRIDLQGGVPGKGVEAGRKPAGSRGRFAPRPQLGGLRAGLQGRRTPSTPHGEILRTDRAVLALALAPTPAGIVPAGLAGILSMAGDDWIEAPPASPRQSARGRQAGRRHCAARLRETRARRNPRRACPSPAGAAP